MADWREQLRSVVAGWGVSPEEQAGIVDELEQHLELEFAELCPRIGEAAARDRIMAQVNDPALRSAIVRPRHVPLPSVQSSRERARGLSALVRDVRYGWRSLRTSPSTAILGTIALALGIGLTTVMFTIIYGLVLRGLPFERADRIAMVMQANPSQGEEELALSMHDFFAYREVQRSFETFGAWSPITVNVADDERPERVEAARVTTAALDITRIHPLLGRSLQAADERPGGGLVVVLSESLWHSRYGGDTTVIGRAVRLNGQPATIVGVMPKGFGFPREARLWVPLRLDPSSAPWGAGPHVNGVGRLRADVPIEQARAELGGIASRIAADHPEANKGVIVVVQPYIRATIPSRVYALLYAMFGAVALVFLVACTNVANLLLARAAHRSKEVAIRVTLGASRIAIARQFLVEALVLSVVASALGALIAKFGIAAFEQATVGQLPFWADFRLHPQVFGFIALAALMASLVSGFLPAITAARSDITEVMKDQAMGSSSRRSGRLSRGLVVFEIALSSALLIVAAMATRSVLNLRGIEPNFRTADVMTGRVTLSTRDTVRQATFFERLEQELAALPGASATSLSTNLPGPGWTGAIIAVEGRTYASPRNRPNLRHLAVTPGFFATFGVSVTRGRPIGDEDRAGTLPVVIVNQRFVESNFPETDPLGKRINLNAEDAVPRWATIVGVMPNLYASDPRSVLRGDAWPAEMLTAFRQQPRVSATIAVQTAGDPGSIARPLRSLVATLDRDLPVYALAPMNEALAQSRAEVGVFGGLFMVFGLVALALATIGLYAVLAFSVSRREREMGIRMALGAATADVVRLVLKDGAGQLALGASIGLLMGIGLSRGAQAVLFDVQATDPVILGLVIAVLAAAGLVACVGPALRATRADPVRSLRSE